MEDGKKKATGGDAFGRKHGTEIMSNMHTITIR